MTAASDAGLRRGIRTIGQTIAGGGLTALVSVLAGGLDPAVQAIVMAAFTALAAFLQNWAEQAGAIPTFLPTRTTVSPALGGAAQATVGAVIEGGGKVVGQVLDTAGDVVGKVTGQVDQDDERGSVIVAALVVLAVIVLGFVACDALFDDEDERDDLGAPALILDHRDGDDRENTGSKDKGRESRGDCEGSTNCDERDFSPELTDSPVTICVQPGSCQWGGDEAAALAKLDPILLIQTIQNGAKAIGEAAGTMAGAVAAFPIGILL